MLWPRFKSLKDLLQLNMQMLTLALLCILLMIIYLPLWGFMQKERDLELAARIGQSLLKKNKALSERNELLEEQVEHIREEVCYRVNEYI